MNNPDASYTHLRNVASTLGAHVTSQAISQRFGPASADLLKATLSEAAVQMICCEEQVPELLSRFPSVYAQDGSIVSFPEELASRYPAGKGITKGGRRSSLRIQVRWDLAHGGMQGPWLQAGVEAECSGPAMEWSDLPTGSLFLCDSGFSSQRMTELGRQGKKWLTSARADMRFYDSSGVKWSLEDYLQVHGQQPITDTWIQAGLNERMPCRLIAIRADPKKAEKRRNQEYVRVHMPHDHKGSHQLGPKAAKGVARRPKSTKSRQKHTRVSAGRRRLADWTILLTNVPEVQLNAEEALVLRRVRWQQELLWKLWKQHGKIDSWRSEKTMRIETEMYAKLLALLVEYWEVLLGCWQDPRRSLRKAQQMSQWSASALCFALQGEMDIDRTLSIIAGAMKGGCRIDPRRKKPNTYQLIEQSRLIGGLG
jgi:hypothetical protein